MAPYPKEAKLYSLRAQGPAPNGHFAAGFVYKTTKNPLFNVLGLENESFDVKMRLDDVTSAASCLQGM